MIRLFKKKKKVEFYDSIEELPYKNYMKFNKEMTDRNAAAGRRMRKEHGDGPVKTVAHDYGNGDVREVGK